MFCSISLLFFSFSFTIATSSGYQWQKDLGAPDDWQKYVRSPPTEIVRPVRVLSNYTLGNVTNPNGLLAGESTVLTMTVSNASNASVDVPTIVVDFGQNIAGYLSISFGQSFNSTPGLPGLRLAFSETLQYLTNVSDFSRSDNADTGVSPIWP